MSASLLLAVGGLTAVGLYTITARSLSRIIAALSRRHSRWYEHDGQRPVVQPFDLLTRYRMERGVWAGGMNCGGGINKRDNL